MNWTYPPLPNAKRLPEAASNVPESSNNHALADDAVLEEVTTGKDGILNALEKGGLHISMSTRITRHF